MAHQDDLFEAIQIIREWLAVGQDGKPELQLC